MVVHLLQLKMLVKQLIHCLLLLLLLLCFPGLPYLIPDCVLLRLDPELSSDFLSLLSVYFLEGFIPLYLFLFQVFEAELLTPQSCFGHILLCKPFLDCLDVRFVLVYGFYHVLL